MAEPIVDTSNEDIESTQPTEQSEPEQPVQPKPEQPKSKITVEDLVKQFKTFKRESATKEAELASKLETAQKKIKDYESEKLSDDEKRQKEYKEALSALEKEKNEKDALRLENIKMKAFLSAGLRPDFMKFVTGTSEEEINESIEELKALIDKEAKAAAPKTPDQGPTNPPLQQPTSRPTSPATPTKRTFTQAEIARMSPAEYAKNRAAILEAAAKREIK